jgi:glucosamine--fructose-6-phosphate aminotransferase (isomerizing)
VEFKETPNFIKEIKEQPKVLANTLALYLAPNFQLKMNRPPLDDQTLGRVGKVYIAACGASYHAGLAARGLIEEWAQLPVVVEPASECGRRRLMVDEATLAVGVSQSGRSRETLAALELAGRRGAVTLAVVNQSPSPLTEAADGALTTLAGQVRTLSSTKAFTTQTLVMGLLALRLAQRRGLSKDDRRRALDELSRLPELFRHALRAEEQVQAAARLLIGCSHAFLLARGHLLPIVYEGALKLKEIAKFHAEGCSAGEFGHGPLAIVGPDTPAMLIAFDDELDAGHLDLAVELKARGVPLILLSEDGPKKDQALAGLADLFVPLPPTPPSLRPLTAVAPLQLLAYHAGRLKGLDVDHPGGLLHGDAVLVPEADGPSAERSPPTFAPAGGGA